MNTTYEHTKRLAQQMSTTIRSAIALLLMLTLGSGSVWGQEGVWYIANDNTSSGHPGKAYSSASDTEKYYLVPAANPQQTNAIDAYYSPNHNTNNGDPEKPFLATALTNKDLNSIWIVKESEESGCYFIIHALTGKYAIYEVPLPNDPNKNTDTDETRNGKRKTMHLQTIDNGDYNPSANDNFKFVITTSGGGYNIRPKRRTGWYWNPAGQNNDVYYGQSSGENPNLYRNGLVGVYNNAGTNSIWHFEDASSATTLTPVISNVNELNNTFTITSPAAAFSTIHYTTDGNTIPDADTGTSATSGNPINITGNCTVQAVGVFGSFFTPLAGPKKLEPICCKAPVISYSKEQGKVTITSDTENANIYYTLNGDIPNTLYVEPFSVTDQQTVKAIAKKTGFPDSEIAIVKVVLNPTITIAENELTYNGSAKEPAVNIVKDGDTTIPASEYTVTYSNNINASSEAVVTITDNPGGNYIISGSANFTINPKVVTITAHNASKTYDGTALTENGFTASELETGDTHTFTVTITEGSTITNAGTEPNVIATVDGSAVTTGTETAIGNYLVTTVNGTLTISPKSLGDGNTAAEGITVEMTDDGSLSAVKDGSTTLVENTDYTQEAEEEGSDKIITITGKGNYTGIVKGIYASPQFDDPDGDGGSGQAAAVYMAKRDLSCPSGINPYIIRKVNPSIGTAVITPLDYIPVDVPVLLLSDAEPSGFVASPKDPSTPEVTAQTKNSNLLKVSAGGETVKAAQIYMFYKGEFVLTKAGTLKEGKFYLNNPNYTDTPTNENSGNSNARGLLQFVIDDEEPTGITEFETSTTKEPDTDVWYTLDGRRLSVKPTKAGIYIHQGQKEYIKR